MKTKLVLWGKIAEEQRVLAAIELKAEDNRVATYIFPQEIVTDEFVETMMEQWRNNKEVEFPEGYQYSEVPLSVTEPIIPADLVLERADLLTMAQSEWHVIVLSAKLHEVYKNELSDIRDKISQLEKYDAKLWEQLKGFWDRVREQIKDQNLFKEQADELQSGVNTSFDALKKLRAKIEEEFQARSQSTKAQFIEKLQQLEGQITEGSRLGMVFDELKKLQQKFRDVKFTKEDRAQVWERLDSAFKTAKGKRYGGDTAGGNTNEDNSAEGRFDRRLSGLEQAMDRMMKSIDRDNDDLAFQVKKIATTDGQLEAQIRQAKVKMIEERIRSKRERLDDMEKTKGEILKQIEKQKQRDAKRAERDRIEEAKKEAQAKIEAQMAEEAAKLDTGKLEKAAEIMQKDKETAIKSTSSFEEMASNLSDTLTDTVEDTIDTLKATAMVIGERIRQAIASDDATDEVNNIVEEAEQAAEERISKDLAVAEMVRAADEATDDIVHSIADAVEQAIEEIDSEEKKE